MRWISRHLTHRPKRMDGGAQTACLLWLVPRYPWGEVIFILVKIGSSYLSDRRFCPDIDLCSVFNFPIIKDTLADKVLDIDYKRRKGNVRESSMRIGIRSTKRIETVCKEDGCITAFEAYFIIPTKVGHIETIVWMNFDNTKDPEKLIGKELCVGFVSTKVPPINYLKDDLSFFDDMSIDSCTTTKLQ